MSSRFLLFPTAGPTRTIDAWRWIRTRHPDATIDVVVPDPTDGLTCVPASDENGLAGLYWWPGDLSLGDAIRGGRGLRKTDVQGSLHLYPEIGGRRCFAVDLAILMARPETPCVFDGRYRPFRLGTLAVAAFRRSILHRVILALELGFTVVGEVICVAALPPAWAIGRLTEPLRRIRRRRGDPVRATFLAFYPQSAAGARYRAHAWSDAFRDDDQVMCRVLDPASSAFHRKTFGAGTPEGRFVYTVAVFLRRLWHLLRVAGDDVVVLRLAALPYHPYGGPALERLLCRLGPRLVYDIDDAIHLYYQPPHTTNPILRRIFEFLHAPNRVAGIIRMADDVIAGNPTLAEFALTHRDERVHFVPTCIDIDRYPARPVRTEAPLTIGWVGTPWNLRHIDMAAPALAQVARRRNFRLLIVSSESRALLDVPVENRTWTLEREVADILEMDVGIMPLEEGAEPAAKCGFKALQYMACGIPAIVSPVGVNTRIVTDGENGWVARSQEDWLRALESALGDPETRARIGRAARRTVMEHFTFDAHRSRMRAILRGEDVTAFEL